MRLCARACESNFVRKLEFVCKLCDPNIDKNNKE